MSPLIRAQPMAEAGTQLADLISSLLQRRATVSLEFQNLTALGPAESSSFRAALQQELRKTGVETTTAAQPEALRVTISENVRGLLFVAAVSSGENRQIAMLPWSVPPAAVRKPRVKLSVQPMLEQSEAVLDILLMDSRIAGPEPQQSSQLPDGCRQMDSGRRRGRFVGATAATGSARPVGKRVRRIPCLCSRHILQRNLATRFQGHLRAWQ